MTEEQKKLRSTANIKYWDGRRKPRLQKNGYITICIGNKKKYLHRAIMEEYIGRPLKRTEHVHHINGDRTDNRIDNLELLDAKEHLRRHAKANEFGASSKGKAPTNKTPQELIDAIRKMRESGAKLLEIADAVGRSYVTVQKYAREGKHGNF